MSEQDFQHWVYAVLDHPPTPGTGETPKGVKGIRAARSVLGDRLGSTLKRSKETWDELVESEAPVVRIGGTDDHDTALEAAAAVETASEGLLKAEVVSKSAEPQKPAGDAGNSREIPIYKVRVNPDTSDQLFPHDEGFDAGEDRDAIAVVDVDALNPFSWEACASALVQMAAASGNPMLPSIAAAFMRTLGLHGDSALWGEAVAAIELAFPDVEG